MPSTGSSRRKVSILKPGTKAPGFTLKTTPDQSVSLRDFLGRPVVIAFYPTDWSPVCSDEMGLYAQVMPEFKKFHAEVLGISVDGVWTHLAFAKDRKLNFPLLSDFEPKGAVSRAYGAYEAPIGEAARAIFVIDKKGIIRWSMLSPDGVNPGAEGILSALEKLGKIEMSQNYKAPRLTLPVGERDHIQGAADAPLVLVEYGDYQCPYCGAAYPIVKKVQKELGARLRFVFRNFPITNAHPQAEWAAETAEAAAAQGKFWEMHDYLYENQGSLGDEAFFASYARKLKLDSAKIGREVAQHSHSARIEEDYMSGIRSGVNGTPTFFINGVRYDGYPEFGPIVSALKEAKKATG